MRRDRHFANGPVGIEATRREMGVGDNVEAPGASIGNALLRSRWTAVTMGLFFALSGCQPAPKDSAVASREPIKNTQADPPINGAPASRKSIRNWVSCDGVSDDTAGLTRAFSEARHGAITLVVDCPVRLKIGTDIARTIFIDDGTNVEFSSGGKLTVDNVYHPAFVIANSNNITLTNWNIEYDASIPADWNVTGFQEEGRSITAPGHAKPAPAFNDLRMTKWLSENRGIVFDKSLGGVTSFWAGPTNTSSIFFISGDSSNLRVTGMRMYVPQDVGGDRFIPMAFSFTENYRSNQTVTAKTPITAQYVSVPHQIVFSDIELDGTYMGWQGNLQNADFSKIRSHRYGDLQDAAGGNVGGVGKWFAPPHLFYLNYVSTGDVALANKDLRIEDVVDDGPRVGVARDKGGTDTVSGYALSLKIGCIDCSVTGYKSNRPDGFLDVLPSVRLTISNVDASYNSHFLNDVFPGWRFPVGPYKEVTFDNIKLKDVAAVSTQMPIGNTFGAQNEMITFKDVTVEMNKWSGADSPIPTIAGNQNHVALKYLILADASPISSNQEAGVMVSLQATPKIARMNQPIQIKWTSRGATECEAGDDWSGRQALTGTTSITLNRPTTYHVKLVCRNQNGSSTATLPIVVN